MCVCVCGLMLYFQVMQNRQTYKTKTKIYKILLTNAIFHGRSIVVYYFISNCLFEKGKSRCKQKQTNWSNSNDKWMDNIRPNFSNSFMFHRWDSKFPTKKQQQFYCCLNAADFALLFLWNFDVELSLNVNTFRFFFFFENSNFDVIKQMI